MNSLKNWGPMTVLLVIVAVIIVLVGGVITIVQPASLSFKEYVDALWKLGAAIAGLGIGRGVHLAGKAQSPSYNADLSDTHGADDTPQAEAPVQSVPQIQGPGTL